MSAELSQGGQQSEFVEMGAYNLAADNASISYIGTMEARDDTHPIYLPEVDCAGITNGAVTGGSNHATRQRNAQGSEQEYARH